ncbi:MAG: aspartyl protease family protein [Acidobacteriota bacterium]
MRRFTAVLCVALGAVSHAPCLEPPGSVIPLLRVHGGMPVVAVRVRDTILRLALDTGTSRTLVSARAAARLGVTPTEAFVLASVAGAPRTGLCGPVGDLRVGRVSLTIPCIGWVPSWSEWGDGSAIDGLLGADALSATAALIDTRHGIVRLAPARSLAPWVEGVRLPLERIGRRLAVRVEVPAVGPRVDARMVLDSGADGVVLFGDVGRRAAATAAVRRATGRLSSGNAGRSVRLLSLGTVRVGHLDLDAGTAGVIPEPGPNGEDGLLPLHLLGPVLLDMSAGVLVAQARLRSAPSPVTASVAIRDAAAGR